MAIAILIPRINADSAGSDRTGMRASCPFFEPFIPNDMDTTGFANRIRRPRCRGAVSSTSAAEHRVRPRVGRILLTLTRLCAVNSDMTELGIRAKVPNSATTYPLTISVHVSHGGFTQVFGVKSGRMVVGDCCKSTRETSPEMAHSS